MKTYLIDDQKILIEFLIIYFENNIKRNEKTQLIYKLFMDKLINERITKQNYCKRC